MKFPAIPLMSLTAILMGCSTVEKQRQPREYPPDANGLSCAIALTAESKNEGRVVFILKNVSGSPIKISGLASPWRSQSSDVVAVYLSPETWKSDAPGGDQMLQSLIVIGPGDSFSFPVNIGSISKGLPVEMAYSVSEEFGKKYGIWHGEILVRSGPIVE